MLIKLNVKPVSVNAAFKGRRFKTPTCNAFDQECQLKLNRYRSEAALLKYEYYKVTYNFYLKNWQSTDYDNCLKVIQDNLVKARLISDDRKIMQAIITKVPSDTNWVEIEIEEYKL